MERGQPLAVRKELLLTRAALERVELEQSVRALRRAGGRFSVISRLLGLSAAGRSFGMLPGALSLLREYPYLGSVATLAVGAARGTRVGKWFLRLSLMTAVIAGAIWVAARRNDTPRR